jgi:hypothetical protein
MVQGALDAWGPPRWRALCGTAAATAATSGLGIVGGGVAGWSRGVPQQVLGLHISPSVCTIQNPFSICVVCVAAS